MLSRHICFWTLALVGIFMFVAARSQDLKIISSSAVRGECHVELNSTDLGCAQSMVYTRFENQRHLVNFPGTEFAAVGFAGT